MQGHQAVQPLLLDFFWNLIRHGRRRGVLLRGIGEGPHAVKGHFLGEGHQFFKVRFRFPGEAHNEGGAQAEAHLPGQGEHFFGMGHGAPAVHFLQQAGGGVLEGQIQIFADIFVLRHGFQQRPVSFIRVHVQAPQPFYPFDGGSLFQQLPQRTARIHAVAGGILSDENVLLHALSGQGPHLVQNVFHRPGTVRTPNQGNGAVGAAVVAAVAGFDVGGISGRGQHPAAFVKARRPFGIGGPLAVQRLGQIFPQARVLGHPQQTVDFGNFLQ